jgi:hypothetical protein
MDRNRDKAGRRFLAPGREKGFTLTEVVTAIFIFMVGIVGVISLFAAAAVLSKGARDKALSALVIQEVISRIDLDLKRGGYRDANGALTAIEDGTIPGHERYKYRAEFVEDGLSSQSMVVAQIHLTWMEKGKERGESFDYVFRPGPEISDTIELFNSDRYDPGKPNPQSGNDDPESDGGGD